MAAKKATTKDAGKPASILSRERVLDWMITDLRTWAKKGDATAGLELHRYLARALREDALTPLAREMLVKMHEQIAEGTEAAEATFTKNVANRAPAHLRNRVITNRVAGMIALYEHWERTGEIDKAPTRRAIFAEIAAELGITAKTVENIYSRRKHPGK